MLQTCIAKCDSHKLNVVVVCPSSSATQMEAYVIKQLKHAAWMTLILLKKYLTATQFYIRRLTAKFDENLLNQIIRIL